MNKVIVRAIGRNKWAGTTYYKGCATYLSPYFTRSGVIYTGLTYDKDPENIALKERLERALGQDLSPTSNFWVTYFIRIGGTDVYIDPSDPRGELDYLFLKNNKRVAKSLKEIKPGNDFVLIDENAEAEVSNIYNRNRVKAIKEYDKMTMTERRRALRLYGFNPDNITDEVVENRLLEFVEKDPTKFMELWVNNKSRETEYLIKQAISRKVMTRNKNIYKYGQDTIGTSLEEAIDFLDNPVNNEVKRVILADSTKE
jgi:hypothetical protein